MRKFSKFAVSVLFGSSSIISSTHIFAADKISISINDKIINSDTAPFVLHGTTLVPLTVIKDLSGVQYEWDNANKMVTIQMKNQGYKLKIGDMYLTTDKEVKYPLTAAAILKHNHVMIPLRLIAELSGSTVLWNSSKQTVFITSGNTESHPGTKMIKLGGTYYTVPTVSKEYEKYSFAVKTPEGIIWSPAPGKSAPNDPWYYPATPFVFFLSDPKITYLNVDQAKKLFELPNSNDDTYTIIEDVNSVGDYLVYHTYEMKKGMVQSRKSQAWSMKVTDPGSNKEIERYQSAGGYTHYYGISQQDGLYVSLSQIPGNADGSYKYDVFVYTLASGEKKSIEKYTQDENGFHFEFNNKDYTVQLTQV